MAAKDSCFHALVPKTHCTIRTKWSNSGLFIICLWMIFLCLKHFKWIAVFLEKSPLNLEHFGGADYFVSPLKTFVDSMLERKKYSKAVCIQHLAKSQLVEWHLSNAVMLTSVNWNQAWLNIETANKSETRLIHSSTACPIFKELVT